MWTQFFAVSCVSIKKKDFHAFMHNLAVKYSCHRVPEALGAWPFGIGHICYFICSPWDKSSVQELGTK